MSDLRKIQKILGMNASKNFVDRIINKDSYPTLDLGDGNYATHKMAYGEADGKYFVYPTVIYDPKNRKLVSMSPDDAWDYAMKTGEFIEFNDEKEAESFSKNYKKVWD